MASGPGWSQSEMIPAETKFSCESLYALPQLGKWRHLKCQFPALTRLKSLEPGQFQRTGQHSTDGPLSLEALVARITGHIPHHIKFIEEKRAAMTDKREAT